MYSGVEIQPFAALPHPLPLVCPISSGRKVKMVGTVLM